MNTGRPVLVSDLHEVGHPHWPRPPAGPRPGPTSPYPLQIGVISMGVLDLYRDQPGPLSAAELAGALLCADLAFWALLGLRAGTDADRTVPRQWGLDRPRAQIHQTTGMVTSQLGISAESALATLRAFAYSHGQPLDEVAREVITWRLRFPADDQ